MTEDNTEIDRSSPSAPGTRPPFTDRNLAAMKSGARSPRVWGKVAEAIAAELVAERPDLADFPEELAALAQTEAVVSLLRLHVAAYGLSRNGELHASLIDRYLAAERAAAKRRDAMGLSPIGEAVLARERAATAALTTSAAVDLDALARRGRAALDARKDIVASAVAEAQAEYELERAKAAELHAQTATEATKEEK